MKRLSSVFQTSLFYIQYSVFNILLKIIFRLSILPLCFLVPLRLVAGILATKTRRHKGSLCILNTSKIVIRCSIFNSFYNSKLDSSVLLAPFIRIIISNGNGIAISDDRNSVSTDSHINHKLFYFFGSSF